MRNLIPALILLTFVSCGRKGEISPAAQKALQDVDEYRKNLAEYADLNLKIESFKERWASAMEKHDQDAQQKIGEEAQPFFERKQALDSIMIRQKRTLDAQLKELVDTNPKDYGLLDARSQFMEVDGMFGTAIEDLQKALVLAPKDRALIVRHGNLLRRMCRYHEARKALEQVLHDDPKNPAALAIDALTVYALNDYDGAIAKLGEAVKLKDSMTPTLAEEVVAVFAEAQKGAVDWKQELKIREAEARADDLPRVRIVMDKGPIVVELYENEAPNAVASFIHLCTTEFYNGIKVHGFQQDSCLTTGCPYTKDSDPDNDGTGGPNYFFKDEVGPGHRNHFRGTLSLYHGNPDRNGSQFRFMLRPGPLWDGKFTVFGRVIEGMEIVDQLRRGDVIKETQILRKRPHAYRPTVE